MLYKILNIIQTFTFSEFHEMASSGFMHTDLIDQKYLCFLLVKSCVLNLIRIEKTTNSRSIPIFGATFSLPAKDAVAMNVSVINL